MKTVATLLTLFAVLAATAYPQRETATPQSQSSLNNLNYRISPGDNMHIKIEGENDLTNTQSVDINGEIRLIYIREKIHISDLTRLEAEKKISDAYFENRILKQAQTTVEITNTAPKEVFLSGQVNSQGPYAFPPEMEKMELSELITRAGGMTDIAKSWAVRLTKNGSNDSTVHDVRKMLNGSSKESPVYVQPGDQIWVPERLW